MKSSLIISLLGAACVSAHGYVSKVSIGGRDYLGVPPRNYGSSNSGVVRQITDHSPVTDVMSAGINCGAAASPAAEVADANPGSQILFTWRNGPDNAKWIHTAGPVITYLASCGKISCAQFDASKAQWFKIQQDGKKPGDYFKWIQEDIFNGGQSKVTLPATLAPGNYLIRHEIIGLHQAHTRGAAEFFPSCAQLRVGGNQSGKPAPEDLVRFPGAYSASHGGILLNTYDIQGEYEYPGPPIAKLVTGAASESSVSPAVSLPPIVTVPSSAISSATPSTSVVPPAATAPPTTTKTAAPQRTSVSTTARSCRRATATGVSAKRRNPSHRRRHHNRAMRASPFERKH